MEKLGPWQNLALVQYSIYAIKAAKKKDVYVTIILIPVTE